MKKKITVIIVFVLLTVLISSITVQAESYTYTKKKKVMELPLPYEVSATVSSAAQFESPVDMHVYGKQIYVLDSIRNDLTVIDENYSVSYRISFLKDGATYETNQLSGFYIYKDIFYII